MRTNVRVLPCPSHFMRYCDNGTSLVVRVAAIACFMVLAASVYSRSSDKEISGTEGAGVQGAGLSWGVVVIACS